MATDTLSKLPIGGGYDRAQDTMKLGEIAEYATSHGFSTPETVLEFASTFFKEAQQFFPKSPAVDAGWRYMNALKAEELANKANR